MVGATEATAPLAWQGSRVISPLADSYFLLCNIGLNCSEILLLANFAWVFVAFAHLALRVCVEYQAWVRVGVSRAVKASLKLYLKLQYY